MHIRILVCIISVLAVRYFERNNDVQLILGGKARMAVVPISDAVVSEPYNPRSDNGFFEVEEGKGAIYEVEPGTFLIFTPADVHKAGVKFEEVDTIKRLFIKVRAVVKDE